MNRMPHWMLMPLLLGAAMTSGNTRLAHAGESGEQLYRTYCAQCHGLQGNGKSINARDMSVQPRDHTDPQAMSVRSDADIFKAIKEGGQAISKSVLMPPWGGVLSDDEINELVMYLRHLCQCRHGDTS